MPALRESLPAPATGRPALADATLVDVKGVRRRKSPSSRGSDEQRIEILGDIGESAPETIQSRLARYAVFVKKTY